jgi:hypothetical protein
MRAWTAVVCSDLHKCSDLHTTTYRGDQPLRREASWVLIVGGWGVQSKKKRVHFLNS